MNKKKRKHEQRMIQRLGRILFVIVLAVLVFALGMLFNKIKGNGSVFNQIQSQSESDVLQEEGSTGDAIEEELVVQEPTEEELAAIAKAEIEARFDEEDRVIWKECASEDEIVIDFIGDFCLAEGKNVVNYLDTRENGITDCLSPDVMNELTSADLMMLNHEFALSTKGSPIEGKAYTYRGNPSRVQEMVDIGTDIVSLANNHAYDYGPDALVETIEVLEEADIPFVGAGRNLEEAMEPYYFVMNNKVIAIVSATQIERSTNYTKQATEERAGVLKCLNPELFLQVVAEAEEKSDYVIAYVHWGTENTPYYGDDQINLAEAFADAGADVIIGGHTHCLQGIDYVDGVPVIYSLGNFWFNNKTLDTGIFQVVIDDEGNLEFRFIPCVQTGCRTYMAEDEERQDIIDYMNSISGDAYIDETGLVTEVEE